MHGKERRHFLDFPPLRYTVLFVVMCLYWVAFGLSVLSVGLCIVILIVMVNSENLLCVICGTPYPSNMKRIFRINVP